MNELRGNRNFDALLLDIHSAAPEDARKLLFPSTNANPHLGLRDMEIECVFINELLLLLLCILNFLFKFNFKTITTVNLSKLKIYINANLNPHNSLVGCAIYNILIC